jgi:hypothetical protein
VAPPEPQAQGEEPPQAATSDLMKDVREAGPAAGTSLNTLWDREDEESHAAVASLAASPGQAGDAILARIEARRALDRKDAIEAALFSGQSSRARHAIEVLERLRADFAIELLDRASKSHPDKSVRREALVARKRLFNVDGQ